MRSIMIYEQWDIVLLPFPFTDLKSSKKRPSVIISPKSYNSNQDVVVLFVTSNMNTSPKTGDYKIKEWKASDLPKPSLIRMKFATIDRDYILKKIGSLQEEDISSIKQVITDFFSLKD